MPKTGGPARFAQEVQPSRFVTEIFFADNFQCYRHRRLTSCPTLTSSVDSACSEKHRFHPMLLATAEWAEFHCCGKLIAATGTRAHGLCFMGPSTPQDAIKGSQSAWISSSISARSDTVRSTSSRKSAA